MADWRRHSTNLDFLRAVAVLCVLLAHFCAAAGLHNPGSLGRFGVVLFFIHTSFVLMASLQAMESTGVAPGWRLAAMFWIRRIFRIYPLAMFAVLMAVILHAPVTPGVAYHWFGLKALLSNLALTQNLTYDPYILAPLWSLPLEVQMYCLLPFAYFIIRGGNRSRAVALWVLAFVLAVMVPRDGRLTMFMYAPCFGSGILAYVLSGRAKRRLPAWTWPLSVFGVIALFGAWDNIPLTSKLERAWILSLALGIVLAHTREGRSKVVARVTHWIAENSYGIYLSHIVILWLGIDVMASSPLWVRGLVLAIGLPCIPVLLYRGIEKPLIGYGVRMANLFRGPVESEGRDPVVSGSGLPAAAGAGFFEARADRRGL